MSRIRINRFIASTGSISRRKADELLSQGRVTVNGALPALGDTINPRHDVVEIDGKPALPQKLMYLAMYKPIYVLTTLHDPEGRACIKDLIPKKYEGVFPVGRLDFDAEGLLLLTNDGQLAHTLHHPSHNVPKTYIVEVTPKAKPEQIRKMEEGVTLDGIRTRPAQIEQVSSHDQKSKLKITLRQGLKNQIKRMALEVGLAVTSIKRISVGPITLEGITPGKLRELVPSEIEKLHKILK